MEKKIKKVTFASDVFYLVFDYDWKQVRLFEKTKINGKYKNKCRKTWTMANFTYDILCCAYHVKLK